MCVCCAHTPCVGREHVAPACAAHSCFDSAWVCWVVLAFCQAKANGTWVEPVVRPTPALPGDDDYLEGGDNTRAVAPTAAEAGKGGGKEGEGEEEEEDESGAESEAEAAEVAKKLAKAAVTDFYAVVKKW